MPWFVIGCSALGTWVFSVAGALLAIPVGIKRKSLGPLVFFGTTGTMLDIIMGITACEREHAERQMQLLEAQNLATSSSSSSAEDHNLATDTVFVEFEKE
ncbi:transmembrane protein [Thalictrum thalictroides]|uniref:Transmembrane protein n=1 Tax=Thalictrum thalictroides TaxID=46969 RepID=A0A7J6WVH8_THATH|nr:transmembrane protein [Thalictrum thalictroides]